MKHKLNRLCFHCECVKEPRTEHCFCCNSCVCETQGHSDLFMNCIASNNYSYFVVFSGLFFLQVLLQIVIPIKDNLVDNPEVASIHDVFELVFGSLESAMFLVWSIINIVQLLQFIVTQWIYP